MFLKADLQTDNVFDIGCLQNCKHKILVPYMCYPW